MSLDDFIPGLVYDLDEEGEFGEEIRVRSNLLETNAIVNFFGIRLPSGEISLIPYNLMFTNYKLNEEGNIKLYWN